MLLGDALTSKTSEFAAASGLSPGADVDAEMQKQGRHWKDPPWARLPAPSGPVCRHYPAPSCVPSLRQESEMALRALREPEAEDPSSSSSSSSWQPAPAQPSEAQPADVPEPSALEEPSPF